MMRSVLILWHILILPAFLWGQNCGWSDTLQIPANSTGSLLIEITDLVNDDLSDPAQGLCGIELGFTHEYVEDLQLWLISPAGDSVQLTGPNTNEQFAFTLFATWNISFIPCSAMALPDPGFTNQWNNLNNTFVSGGNYTGAYYPFQGCLEDAFDNGPANGEWELYWENDNGAATYDGSIRWVRLLFCDELGFDCCFAEGGELEGGLDTLICQNDTILDLDLAVDYDFPVAPPDTSEFGYTYVLSESGFIVDYLDRVDLSNAPAGDYEVCGLSYLLADSLLLPPADGTAALDDIRMDVESLSPTFCGSFSQNCYAIRIEAPPPPVVLDTLICLGDSVQVGDSTYFAGGTYTQTLTTQAGCDSLFTLNLTVQPPVVVNLDTTLCNGGAIPVGPNTYLTSGLYSDTLVSSVGCDSIVNLDLTVLDSIITPVTDTICTGTGYDLGDSTFTTSGFYELVLTSQLGCDSLVQLDLTVLEPQAQLVPPDTLTCASPQVVLDGSGSTAEALQWIGPGGLLLGTSPLQSATDTGRYILVASLSATGLTCTDTAEIQVVGDLQPPIADPGPDTSFTCTDPVISLGGAGTSTGPEMSYQWTTTGGNILTDTSTLSVDVDAGGTYQLIVRNTRNGCADTAAVQVTADTLPPLANAGAATALNCALAQLALDGSASGAGPAISYGWQGPCILSGGSTTSPLIDCGGWYALEVTDTQNGCSAIDSLWVATDTLPPQAAIADPDTLTCADTSILLDATPSSQGAAFQYSWTGPGLLAGQASLQPEVSQPGLYELIVLDSSNQCRDTAAVQVQADTISPVADSGPLLDSLTCLITTLTLGGPNTSLGPEFVYSWNPNEGNITGAADQPTAVVDTSGVYVLTVTDTTNGCSGVDITTVVLRRDPPPADAGPGGQLSCSQFELVLSANPSGPTANLQFDWNGNCSGLPAAGQSVAVDCPGWYYLHVTNTQTGCTAVDSAEVTLATGTPVACLAADTVYLDCLTGNATLDATCSSPGFPFQWYFEGNPVSINTLTPTVDTTGLYTLVVENTGLNCADTAEVLVLANCDPVAAIAQPDTLTCGLGSVVLDGSASSSGPGITYQWVAPLAACIATGQGTAQVQVVCPGDYQLIVTNKVFGASDTAAVTVETDTLLPVALASTRDTLSCLQSEATLTSAGSSPGEYTWLDEFANDLGDADSIVVDQPGTYFLEVRNPVSGCLATSAVVVRENRFVPDVSLASTIFPCDRDTFLLSPTIMPDSSIYTYAWSGPAIAGPADTAGLLIDGPGTYTLLLTNTDNGCTTTDSATISTISCDPCIQVAEPDTITCANPTVSLQGSFCAPCPTCTLAWTTPDGAIEQGTDSLVAVVSAAGTYRLTATDSLGFTAFVEVVVVAQGQAPPANAGPDRFLNCRDSVVMLGDTIAPPDPGYQYQWTFLGNGDLLPDTLPFAEVGAPGSYVLTVTDQLTSCQATDTVQVGEDFDAPLADAGADGQLGCQDVLLALDGSGSATGPAITYLWSGTAPDLIEAGGNSTTPLVSGAGLYWIIVNDEDNGCSARDTVAIGLSDEVPVLPVLPDTVLGCGADSIRLEVSLPETGGPFDYQWCALDGTGQAVNCEADTSLTVGQAGEYQFSIEDLSNGCRAQQRVLVSEDTSLPQVFAGADDTLDCQALGLWLNADVQPAGNYAYRWTELSGQPLSHPDSSSTEVFAEGLYVLEVTNLANQCAATDTVRVAQDDERPTLLLGGDTSLTCSRQSLFLSAQGITSSGAAPSYSWTSPDGNIAGGQDTPTPLINQAGTYEVQIQDPANSCVASGQIAVVLDTVFPQAIVNLAAAPQLDCRTDSTGLDGSASFSPAGHPLSFAWRTLVGSPLQGNLKTSGVTTGGVGQYRLVVTDMVNGCSDSTVAQVSGDFRLPEVRLAEPEPITCIQPTSVLDGSGSSQGPGFDYSWTGPSGAPLPDTLLQLSVDQPGIYTLLVQDRTNGCEADASVQLIADLARPQVRIQAPPELDCDTEQVVLDGSGSSQGPRFAYFWSTPDGLLSGPADSLVTTAAEPGQYRLRVFDLVNGCESIDSTEVQARGIPIDEVAFQVEQPGCLPGQEGSLQVGAVQGGLEPYLYSLDGEFFGTESDFPVLLPGNYQLVVQDVAGCTWDTSFQIVDPVPPEVALEAELTVLEPGDSTLLTAEVAGSAVRVWWLPDSAFAQPEGMLAQWVSPTETTTYTVWVEDSLGCRATDRATITLAEPSAVYIPNAFSPNGDGQNDWFYVQASEEVLQVNRLLLFDRWGNEVFSRQNFSPNAEMLGWDGRYRGRLMNPAVFVYFVEVTYRDGRVESFQGDLTLLR